MGRWIRNLHGGQLVIVLVGIGALGSAVFGVGYRLGKEADADFSLYGKLQYGVPSEGLTRDTVLAEHFFREGSHTNHLALRFLLVGIAILATIIPTLWIWFGARRRNAIVAEVVDA